MIISLLHALQKNIGIRFKTVDVKYQKCLDAKIHEATRSIVYLYTRAVDFFQYNSYTCCSINIQ